MNTNKSLPYILIFVFFSSLIVTNIFSQNNPASTILTFPKAYTESVYGIENSDSIIQNGTFDNYRISSTPGYCQTVIAVNKTNQMNFVATDNRIIGTVAGPPYVFYTTNGGINWTGTTNGIVNNQGDPVLASDAQNNLYLSVLNSGPRVFKSATNGINWVNLGNVVSNPNADKEWLACDQTQGIYKNNVYVAYSNFNSSPPSVDFWKSTNNANSWQFSGIMGTGSPNPGANICVGPDGKVYLAWWDLNGVKCRVSSDGGATFGSIVIATSYSAPGINNHYVKNYIHVNPFPLFACDISAGAYSGYVYMVYACDPPGPDVADINLVRSTDGGATWSTPTRVNWDDPTTNDNWMPGITVDGTGKVWIFWWDSRNDVANIMTDTYAAYSTNGGQTFSTNIRVGITSFNPNTIAIYMGTQSYYLGDYQTMSSGNNFSMPCYTGDFGTLQDFTLFLPDYGIFFRKPVDTIAQGQTETNRVIIPLRGPYSGTVILNASVTPAPSPGTITFTWNPSNVRTINNIQDSVAINAIVSSNVPVGTYTISVTGTETGGPRVHTRTYRLIVGTTGIKKLSETANEFSLAQNYPNPFNPVTIIDYSLPKKSLVRLSVFDILGREVAVLVNNAVQNAGIYSEAFDASHLGSGVYYYRLSAGDFTETKKMLLVK